MYSPQALVPLLDAALPQTQCTRCGYPDCHAYANAIAYEQAPINQCPPGGEEGVQRLATLTGQTVQAVNPGNGIEGPRAMAIIDEQWCIGCTLCLKACPVDAIIGANKTMHTVLESACTGCELCIPVCPVDCISLESITGEATGWQAWSEQQAQQALSRYVQRADRLGLTVGAQQAPLHQRRHRSKTTAPTRSQPHEGASLATATALPQTAEQVSANTLASRPAHHAVSASPPALTGKAALLADILKKAQAKRGA